MKWKVWGLKTEEVVVGEIEGPNTQGLAFVQAMRELDTDTVRVTRVQSTVSYREMLEDGAIRERNARLRYRANDDEGAES